MHPTLEDAKIVEYANVLLTLHLSLLRIFPCKKCGIFVKPNISTIKTKCIAPEELSTYNERILNRAIKQRVTLAILFFSINLLPKFPNNSQKNQLYQFHQIRIMLHFDRYLYSGKIWTFNQMIVIYRMKVNMFFYVYAIRIGLINDKSDQK